MKTLRVCLSSELPIESDRLPNYLYFAYDTLNLYSGQNYLEENYAIVDELPEEQVYGMIYILNSDGSVHRLINYADVTIAEIEDPAQIEILKKAGTMFYVNARHRYIDSQRRVLTLPFNDGTYELNAAARRDTIYDENTILKFNMDTQRFEVYSDTSESYIDFSKPFRGGETSSVKMSVNGPRISGDIKVSKQEKNILKLAEDGLYIPTLDYVTKETFDEWTASIFGIKEECDRILGSISEEIEELEDILTPEAIQAKILELLEDKYSDIETALANYDIYVDHLSDIENQVVNYAANTIVGSRDQIINKINDYQSFDDLDSECSQYQNEVNYYEKCEKWLNPSIPYTKKKIILSAAIAALMEESNE